MSDTQTTGRWPLHWQILAAMVVGSLIGVIVNPGDQLLPNAVHVAVTRSQEGISVEEFSVVDESRVVLFRADFDGTESLLENAFPALAEVLSKVADDKAVVTLESGNPRVRVLSTMAGYAVV